MSRCKICKVKLNQPRNMETKDCGGDCMKCMAEAGDPACIAALANRKFIYWPCTPGGSVLADEDHKTEDAAWQWLLAQTKKHGMPYQTIDDLKKRGYEVIDLEDE